MGNFSRDGNDRNTVLKLCSVLGSPSCEWRAIMKGWLCQNTLTSWLTLLRSTLGVILPRCLAKQSSLHWSHGHWTRVLLFAWHGVWKSPSRWPNKNKPSSNKMLNLQSDLFFSWFCCPPAAPPPRSICKKPSRLQIAINFHWTPYSW